MNSGRGQTGFIPGAVMDINFGIAAMGIAIAIMVSLTSFHLKPRPLDANQPGLAAVGAIAAPAVPEGWRMIEARDGTTVIRHIEPFVQLWAVPALLVLTLVTLFIMPLRIPFWLLLVCTCGVWWYGATSSPVTQYVTIQADGSVELRRSAHLVGFMSHRETVAAKDLESVLAHRERPEAYVTYWREKRKIAWALHADSPGAASALATLVRSRLKLPAAPGAGAGGKK